ncbi:MAG: hypothetical protein AB7F64_08100 [Gammaproteobacteria bacterium]
MLNSKDHGDLVGAIYILFGLYTGNIKKAYEIIINYIREQIYKNNKWYNQKIKTDHTNFSLLIFVLQYANAEDLSLFDTISSFEIDSDMVSDILNLLAKTDTSYPESLREKLYTACQPYLSNHLLHLPSASLNPVHFKKLIDLGILKVNDAEEINDSFYYLFQPFQIDNEYCRFVVAALTQVPELIQYLWKDNLKLNIQDIINRNVLHDFDSLALPTDNIDPQTFRTRLATLLSISPDGASSELLKSLRSSSGAQNKLLSDTIIATYLGRSVFSLNDEGFPVYDDWEKILYTYTYTNGVPFRKSDHYSDNFYMGGTYKPDTQDYIHSKKSSLPSFDTFSYSLHASEDTYTFAMEMNRQGAFAKPGNIRYHYVITALGKDNHAFAALTVIDTQNRQTKLVIFINSSEDLGYIYQQTVKFLGEYTNHDPDCEDNIPVILDASLPMQIYAIDNGCALYTTEVVEALIQVLANNSALREELETLSNLPTKQKAEAEIIWKNRLRNEFRTAIEKSMPHLFSMVEDEPIPRGQKTKFSWSVHRRWYYGQSYILKHRQSLLKQAKTELESCRALALQLGMEDELAEIDKLLSKKIVEINSEPVKCSNIQTYYQTHILSEPDAQLKKQLADQPKIRPIYKDGKQNTLVITERNSKDASKRKTLLRLSAEEDQAAIQALRENPHTLFSEQLQRENSRLTRAYDNKHFMFRV